MSKITFRKEGSNIFKTYDPAYDPGSSFYHLLQREYPSVFHPLSVEGTPAVSAGGLSVPHGTTVLSLRYRDGAIVAGDRMATEGYSVSERRIEKVHEVDETSVMAIAGAAGPCMDMIRLFRVELEHYEKIEGVKLSMAGKASKLAGMIKGNLMMAMQGLVVIPIFAGYDTERQTARIYKYDVAGGQYEEAEYYSIGSGGKEARSSLKKIFKKELSEDEAVNIALEALYDASEADIATGGPDLTRGIFPTVKIIRGDGIATLSDEILKNKIQTLIAQQGG